MEDHKMCALWYLMAGYHTVMMCVGCVSMEGNVLGEGDQTLKINVDGRPPEFPIRSFIQHIELIAPPPLIPFTEKPPTLVGNMASRENVVCPLCLEVWIHI